MQLVKNFDGRNETFDQLYETINQFDKFEKLSTISLSEI